MKKYTYVYRKRGLPESEERTGEVYANNYFEARTRMVLQVGEECVIVKVKKEETNNEIQ